MVPFWYVTEQKNIRASRKYISPAAFVMASGSWRNPDSASEDLPDRVILWDEKEVAAKQIKQVGASACGATAALNVLVREKNFFN